MGSNQHRVYNDSDTPLIHKLDWMKEIPDKTKLSEMTIPGSHNSCSLFGICCARTQTWSLVEQMRAGLRFFDIRLRRINNTLRAYHGFVDQKETFDKILIYALDFLEKNQSETIIMEIISEYTMKNCTKSFVELYEEYTQPYQDKIVIYKNEDISLGEIRGKILIIKIFEGSTNRIKNFLIQNLWSINFKCSLDKKIRKIKQSCRRAIALKNSKINLNYLSASSDYAMMTPYSAAKECNEIPMRYHGRLGIVLADYPGEDLIDHLIKQNFIKNENKEIIKSGDKIYMMHNDTHKFLFLDNKNNENNIYCIKIATPLIIRHKIENIGRNDFKSGDEIILINEEGYGYEFVFKIAKTFDKNEDIINDQSVFMLQVFKDNEFKYLECLYENQFNHKYLLNFSKNIGSFSYYFVMKKAATEEEEIKIIK